MHELSCLAVCVVKPAKTFLDKGDDIMLLRKVRQGIRNNASVKLVEAVSKCNGSFVFQIEGAAGLR